MSYCITCKCNCIFNFKFPNVSKLEKKSFIITRFLKKNLFWESLLSCIQLFMSMWWQTKVEQVHQDLCRYCSGWSWRSLSVLLSHNLEKELDQNISDKSCHKKIGIDSICLPAGVFHWRVFFNIFLSFNQQRLSWSQPSTALYFAIKQSVNWLFRPGSNKSKNK